MGSQESFASKEGKEEWMSKSKFLRSECPVACTLDLIGDKWTLLVVRDMICGKAAFNEFSKSPERIATNILADRLEKLVGAGLAERYLPEGSSGREAYRLTARGRSLEPVLESMMRWGLGHIEGTAARMLPKRNGE
jgi:DNA-binding HxlR family transcriptional regulator